MFITSCACEQFEACYYVIFLCYAVLKTLMLVVSLAEPCQYPVNKTRSELNKSPVNRGRTFF